VSIETGKGWTDMRKRRLVLSAVAAVVMGGATLAYVATPTIHAGQSGDAPELGRAGPFRIGTSVVRYTLPDRGRITTWGALTGNLDTADRTLSVRIWYPADGAAKGTSVQYDHVLNVPGKAPLSVTSSGRALADAPPLKGNKYPLVLMSHGYGGWSTQFSNLAEHVASRGYVVASIEHADMPVDGVASFLLSFGNVLVDRTLDQKQILARILADVRALKTPWSSLVAPEKIGLIGYSMGGYGALATAGAPYTFDKDPLSKVPDAAKVRLRAADDESAPIKALVTISPWGGQPESRAWTAQDLAKVKVPVLLIAGNQDDVVNFKDGVSWLYRNMTGTERHMLVYREARHNIVGNEFKLGPDAQWNAYEFLSEPVWRSDRLNAINQHFVTAFLDLTLKGDASKRAYLDVPTVDANAGEWPLSFAEQLNGTVAGSEQQKYWRGFQRRWAAGLEMHRAAAGQPGN
jgi:predicted dienelactone hydrolase